MYGKLLLFIFLGTAVCAGAQPPSLAGKVTRQVAAATLKNNALSKVRFANLQVGKEALRLHVSSVGAGNYCPKVRRFELASSFIPAGKVLKRLENYNWLIPPMTGYISSAKALSSFSPVKEASLLDAAFGPQPQYQGIFVSTFEELRSLSFQPVANAAGALAALQAAHSLAAVNPAGFLAVLVKGNAYRPKDLLLWDPVEAHWISWNYSKSAVLRQNREEMGQSFKDQNVYWSWQLAKQGVIIRPDSYDYPVSVRISPDGINWQEVKLNTPLGDSLWQAWNEGFYISYDRHTHTALFAYDKEAPLFSSVEEVFAWMKRAGAEQIHPPHR